MRKEFTASHSITVQEIQKKKKKCIDYRYITRQRTDTLWQKWLSTRTYTWSTDTFLEVLHSLLSCSLHSAHSALRTSPALPSPARVGFENQKGTCSVQWWSQQRSALLLSRGRRQRPNLSSNGVPHARTHVAPTRGRTCQVNASAGGRRSVAVPRQISAHLVATYLQGTQLRRTRGRSRAWVRANPNIAVGTIGVASDTRVI